MKTYNHYYKSDDKSRKPYKPQLPFKHSAKEAEEYAASMKIYEEEARKWQVNRELIDKEKLIDIRRKKGKILKLDPDTLQVLEIFDGVRQAERAMGFKKGAISIVICQSDFLSGCIHAGGFKWRRSNERNMKYESLRKQLKETYDKNSLSYERR